MRESRLLAIAVVLSLGVHAAGAALLGSVGEGVDQPAAKGGAVSVVGSLRDLVAGSPAGGAVTAFRPLQPIEPARAVPPVSDARRKQPVETVPAVEPVAPSGAVREAVPVEPLTAVTPTPPVLQSVAPQEAATPPPKPRVAKPVEPAKTAAGPVERSKTAAKPPRDKARKAEKRQPRPARRGGSEEAVRGGERATAKTGRARQNGTQPGAREGGGKAAADSYKARVLRRLQRAKRYPPAARAERLEGRATLRFTIQRSGTVTGGRVVRSSGHAVLDEAALAMLRRASPLPPLPQAVPGASMTLTVPVRFSAR